MNTYHYKENWLHIMKILKYSTFNVKVFHSYRILSTDYSHLLIKEKDSIFNKKCLYIF